MPGARPSQRRADRKLGAPHSQPRAARMPGDRQSERGAGSTPAILAALLCGVLLLAYAVTASRPRVIFAAESAFGSVRVLERTDGLRSLHTGDGNARQSALYPDRPGHLELAYTRVAMVGLALAPDTGRLLFVGLGGGSMPMFARHVLPHARIDAVEIDPLIVDVARRFFGFREDPRMTVHTDDGRALIERAPRHSWDVVFLDAFSDDEIPFSLTTREFLESVRTRLAPDGVVVSNLWSANSAYDAMLATYVAVFDQVHLLRVPGRAQRILVAGVASRPLHRDALGAAARALSQRSDLGFDLTNLVLDGYEPLPPLTARVLSDP